MSDWEQLHGKEYRAEHKRTNYKGISLNFRVDDPQGITRERVQQEAAKHGLTAGQWIMELVRENIK